METQAHASLAQRSPMFQGVSGAAERTRTSDPIITNDVLYQLSYSGLP